MMRHFLLAAGCACLLTSCYKDDLDIDTLTTNPIDPDYNGPAVIELESSSTQTYFNPETQETEYILEQSVHIRTDLLPEGLDYSLYITKLGTGQTYDYSAAIPPGLPLYYDVQLGEDYCYEYRLKVGHALTKGYTYCSKAEL